MSGKVVVHIFHADDSSLGRGSHLSERIRQVKDERGVALEYARDAFARYAEEGTTVVSF